MDMPQFVYPLNSQWTFRLFPIQGYEHQYMSFYTNISISLGYNVGVELLAYVVNLCLVLEEIARSFSKVVVLFHSPRLERFDSSQHHQHLLLSVFFVVTILVGV